jgi:hypothetical protein
MVPVRQDKSPRELRLLVKVAKDGKVVQRLPGIALILDGRGRGEARQPCWLVWIRRIWPERCSVTMPMGLLD